MAPTLVDDLTDEEEVDASWEMPDRVYTDPIPLDDKIFQPTALDIDVSDMDFDEWAEIGWPIDQISEAHQWWGGDWYNLGAEKFGREELWQVLDVLKGKTYEVYGYVAERIGPKLRNPDLAYSHHKYAADLETIPQRKKCLKLAFEGEWTTEETRLYVQKLKGNGKDDKEPKEKGETTSVTWTMSFNLAPGDESAGDQVGELAMAAIEAALVEVGVDPRSLNGPNKTFNES